MSPDEPTTTAPTDQRHEQLRQLEHDMKNYLGVITMGLQALEAVREDPEQFAQMSQTIDKEGIQPLKQIVTRLVDVASRNTNG